MSSTTLVTVLTSLTTAMAAAAPAVLFGFLYVLKVQPERAAADELQYRLTIAQAELSRRRMFAGPPSVVTRMSALDEFDARTMEGDRVGEVVDVFTALLNSPAVGGVSTLSIETGTPVDGAGDSIVKLFSRKVAHTPVMLTFDARYEQIGRFFWNLRVLPTISDLQSIDLAPAPESRPGTMRARVVLHVFHRPAVAIPRKSQPQVVDVITPPQWKRDPFAAEPRRANRSVVAPPEPDPVVSSILVSGARRIALVDGRIVRAGDRVRGGVVRSIEPDAVIVAEAGGRARRVEIERPVIRMAKR